MSNSIHPQDPASLKPEAVDWQSVAHAMVIGGRFPELRQIDLRERLIGLLAPIYCTDHNGLLDAAKAVEKYVETGT